MPNRKAKDRKRKRLMKNEQLNRDGRTKKQIARKQKEKNRKNANH